jgi:hypothetical protein
MSDRTLIYDPSAGGDVVANLDFAEDSLIVFDRRGRTLQRWPYGEIIHTFAPGEHRDSVLAHRSRPEIRLQVGDEAVYKAIRAQAPQLRPLRRGWKNFFFVMQGMPGEAQLGICLLAAFAIFGIYSSIADWFK